MGIGLSMTKVSDFDKALRLKGYGSYENKVSQNDYKNLEKVVKVDNDLSVKPKVITCLRDYIDFISTLESSYENPVFYRGQGNANYLINPSSLRKNPANERRMIESFERRFSNELNSCENDMARLVLMQHYGLGTRALDISENPLAALYFACSPMKKFNTNRESEKSEWGEITIFKDPDEENEKKPYDLKQIHSSTVSIISSTAFMKKEFNLWELGMEWKKDRNYMHDEKFIQLRDIIRRSVIVRVPQNNPRIKNQQGAFIIVNANEVLEINGQEKNANNLTKYLLENEYINFHDVLDNPKWGNLFVNNSWELKFGKIKPYSGKNTCKIFDIDPFNLRRIFYKKDGVQQVVLIPPERKDEIVRELSRFNITEDFIYPDMDCVANEINERINI